MRRVVFASILAMFAAPAFAADLPIMTKGGLPLAYPYSGGSGLLRRHQYFRRGRAGYVKFQRSSHYLACYRQSDGGGRRSAVLSASRQVTQIFGGR